MLPVAFFLPDPWRPCFLANRVAVGVYPVRPLRGGLLSLLELAFESGEDSLSVRRFAVREALGEPFEIEIEARSPSEEVDLGAIVGRGAVFRLRSGARHLTQDGRSWTGICSRMELVQAEGTGLSTYRLSIVPRLWLMGQRRNYRVFQRASVPEIARRLLEEWRVAADFRVDAAAHPRLPLRIQYGESDLAFLRRLLEEAGITLYFAEGEQEESRLVLHDRPHAEPVRDGGPLLYVDNPNESAEREYVTRVHLSQAVQPLRHTIRDVDFRRSPDYPLFGQAVGTESAEAGLEQFDYRPGAFLIETAGRGETPIADDKGAARHEERAGRALAERRLEEARVARRIVSFATNAPDLRPGAAFAIQGHARADLSADQKLLVTELSFGGAVGEEWRLSGKAVFASLPYRPPRRTPKPEARGVESAVVVGPKGEEIHTDEFGRVRVQFPWDREGKYDAQSFCWVRVSQGWAGAGFGMMAIPRVGQEVLVGFLGGDPDQPVVVGRLHGGTQPVPYKLPENKAVSGWRTESSPRSGGFNEIRFDDTRGRELVHVQAERSLTKVVKVDETETTGHTREIRVGQRLVLTNGQVSIVLDGPNLTIEGKGKINVSSAEDEVVLKGAPHVWINPAPPRKKVKKIEVAASKAPKKKKKRKEGVGVERYGEGVELYGTGAFREAARAALDALWKTRNGRSVMRKLARTGEAARIVESDAPNGACKPLRMENANRRPNGSPGVGSSSFVMYNPAFKPDGVPAEVVLCKQLVHAYHNAAGIREPGVKDGVRDEDRKAIGLAPFPKRAPTENSLRKELGLPERTGV